MKPLTRCCIYLMGDRRVPHHHPEGKPDSRSNTAMVDGCKDPAMFGKRQYFVVKLHWLQLYWLSYYHFYRPANEVCEGYIFTGVCLSRGRGLGLCPGGLGLRPMGLSVLGVSVQGVSVQGDLCPGGLCPGGSLSWGSLSRGSLSGGLCPGGSLSGGSLSGGSLSRGISVQGGTVQGGLCLRDLCLGGSLC